MHAPTKRMHAAHGQAMSYHSVWSRGCHRRMPGCKNVFGNKRGDGRDAVEDARVAWGNPVGHPTTQVVAPASGSGSACLNTAWAPIKGRGPVHSHIHTPLLQPVRHLWCDMEAEVGGGDKGEAEEQAIAVDLCGYGGVS